MRNRKWPLIKNIVIARSIRVAEAPSLGQPILVYDSSSPVATAYRQLAEFIDKA
jgi:chromosome partitioning protein